ncbi:hypothetical protein D3C75_928440 [compost metagenome]
MLERNGETAKKYRFSDEREWRYVPDIDHTCKMYYNKYDFAEPGAKEEAAKSVADLRLKFEPDDIKYIIIKDESEITEFVNHLRASKGANFSMHTVEKLTTRILTSEQIKTDF